MRKNFRKKISGKKIQTISVLSGEEGYPKLILKGKNTYQCKQVKTIA